MIILVKIQLSESQVIRWSPVNVSVGFTESCHVSCSVPPGIYVDSKYLELCSGLATRKS